MPIKPTITLGVEKSTSSNSNSAGIGATGKYVKPTGDLLNSSPSPRLMIFNDPANFTASAGAGEVFTQDFDNSLKGNPAVKFGLTTYAQLYKEFTANGQTGTVAPIDITNGATVSLFWKMPEATKNLVPANTGSFTVHLGSDSFISTLTNRKSKTFSFNAGNIGWNVMSDHTSTFTTTGAPILNAIRKASIRMDNNNALSGATAVPVALLAIGYKARPKVVLMMDDGYEEQHSKSTLPKTPSGKNGGFFTYLQDKGLKGTVGIIANFVDAGSVGPNTTLTTAQCQEMYDAGFDLVTHGEWPLTQYTTVDAIRRDIYYNRNFLLARGWNRAANLYVYPTGAVNENVYQAIREAGFISARGLTGTNVSQCITQPTAPFVPNVLCLNSVTMGNQTAATMKSWVDLAVLRGQTLFLYGHALEPGTGTASSTLYTKYDEFTQTIDYIKSLKDANQLDVVTYSEWASAVTGFTP